MSVPKVSRAVVDPDVDKDVMHSPLSPLDEKVQAARRRMDEGSSPQKTKESPTRVSPRTRAAEQLKLLGLSGKPPRILFDDKSDSRFRESAVKQVSQRRAAACADLGSMEGVQVTGIKKPLHDASKRALTELINDGERQFFNFAKAINKDLKFTTEFKPAFEALRAVLFSLEDGDFLDEYIMAISLSHDRMGGEFQEFHRKVEVLKDALEAIGIEGLNEGDSINFWSGREGQKRAADDSGSFSDSDVPFFKFLFNCWGYIKTRELMKAKPTPFFTSLLPAFFSAIFASHAQGEVNVYMSSKNGKDDNDSVINADSAFWRAECTLLINNPRVSKINLYLHKGKDERGDIWADPIDLKSKDPEVMAFRDSICLSKREEDFKVSMGSVRSIGLVWKARAMESGLVKFQGRCCQLEEVSAC